MSRPTRSVVAVSGDPRRPELLDALQLVANDCDVVFVETMACAYSRIKQVMPDTIIVLSEIDDVVACELLSMLKFDGDPTHTIVITYRAGQLDAAEECAPEQSPKSALARLPTA